MTTGWLSQRLESRRTLMKVIRLLLTISFVLTLVSARVHAQRGISFRPQLTGPDALAEWSLDGSGSWTVADGMLVLEKAGKPSGPIRRPAALAIFKSGPFKRVTLKAEVRSTAPQDAECYGRRACRKLPNVRETSSTADVISMTSKRTLSAVRGPW